MRFILLSFQLEDILYYIGGIIALILFCAICFFIGLLGVQIRCGVEMLKSKKGVEFKEKGVLKIVTPLIGIIIFYSCLLPFLTNSKYQLGALFLLIPVILGYFNIFLVPWDID